MNSLFEILIGSRLATGRFNSALARVAKGAYGVCLYCEEDISARRMAAVLWAAFCINCHERIDRREIGVDENIERFAPAA